MRRVALAFAVAGVVAPVAWAATSAAITQTSIAGAKLGLTHRAYRKILGAAVRVDQLENGYSRLVFTKRKVAVYFKGKTNRGVEIVTWNMKYRTGEGVGPCGKVPKLKSVYGAELKPFTQGGKTVAYTVGNLIFATNGGPEVTAIALGSGKAAVFIALNAPRG